MNNSEKSGSPDIFRIAAAVLVITIHISPLETINENADFFLTRILARIAVPFFFMITGMFTDFNNPIKSLIKLLKMYLFATAFYIPFAAYSGYFSIFSFWTALKMLIFDGYFYHLWYFPACILGIIIVHYLSKISFKSALIISAVLYLFGLLGDSYYGIPANVPPLKAFYDIIFCISSYTRNGLFFAPICLLLGSKLKNTDRKFSGKSAVLCGSVSFSLLTAEGFLLHGMNVQRHDSMYIFLIPAVCFLLVFLTTLKIPQKPILRKISMWIYIIHPAVIIVLRGASKIISDDFFERRALLLFVLTTAFSIIFSIIAVIISVKFKKIHAAFDYSKARVWAEINMNTLRKNVEFLREISPGDSELMPVVKADAYGHGAVLITRELNKMGIRAFCVATADEGVRLRCHGIKGKILILGCTCPAQFPLLKIFGLSQTIVDYNYAKLLNHYGKVHAHIGIDTGMRRLGIRSENYGEIRNVFAMKNLIIDGIFTHLSADETVEYNDKQFTKIQADRFFEIADELAKDGHYPKLHLLASYGLLNYAHLGGDYVRVGIALYGGVEHINLTPVLSLKTRVASVRNVYKDEPVGYGLENIAKQDIRVAALAIGYADGLPRALSDGSGAVLINGKRAPIIGKICMDQTLVDVTGIDVNQGDIAVIIGNSGNETIFPCEVARQAGTISNEVLSRLGSRVKRIIIK